MRRTDIHREALVKATECQLDLELDTFSRIDIFACFPALNMKLMFDRLDSCAALYMPAGPFGVKASAMVNSNHPLPLQRYSAAHELGHHRFDHGARVDRENNLESPTHDAPLEERLAESFAAWFLMPVALVDLVFDDVLQIDKARTGQDVYQASLRFGCSYSAACVHLASVGRLSTQDSKAFKDIAVKKLKLELTSSPPPGGWRNDVWRLKDTDIGTNLLVRAGDRLIFTTSQGREPAQLPDGVTCLDESTELASVFETARRYVIDIASDAPARRVTLDFDDASGTASAFELEIERPRRGLYVPVGR